jgi:two-component system, cell cycle sensor histidine kinase PleC
MWWILFWLSPICRTVRSSTKEACPKCASTRQFAEGGLEITEHLVHSRNLAIQSKSTLLARYCETMGELRLRSYTEKAMKAARAEAELSAKAKSSFLGTMSHELRTPLNAIIGFSEIIEASAGKSADETLAENAHEIRKAGRHMLGVINDILEMSKIDSGALQLNLADYSIAEIVEDCLPMIRDRVEAKEQTLDVRIARDTPPVPLDMRRIRQVLLNLLTNATKFTPAGGSITVAVRGTKAGGCLVAISDTGVGMTPDEMRIAMRPFGQVQNMYTRTEEGTGLGLAISYGLVKAHSGEFYMESEPGVGTTVVVTLPKKPGTARSTALADAGGGGERAEPRRENLTTGSTK